ncbi:MAG: type II toxin-antitoxin system VapC family toxin [Actinobacteria bacterium]|nr:type II toxin-antitoxin system VapC family toxin [Actinomycetota bacterium]
MGLTHLDAGVIIGFLDANDAHHNTARAALTQILEQGDHIAMAASALAECLVGPARKGDASIQLVRDALTQLPVKIVDLNSEIAAEAARIRSRHRTLRLPDALAIATAVVSDATQLVTTDRRWPTQHAMKLNVNITQI